MTNDGDYPLNCIDDTGDGFSGWFAISNPRLCNDFCYWQVVASYRTTSSASGGSNEDEGANDNDTAYNSRNTANPHVQSVIYYTPTTNNNETDTVPAPVALAYWTCLFDVSSDKVLVSNAGIGQRWIDVGQNYVSSSITATMTTNSSGTPFPFLRCQKGAGEQLSTWSSSAIKSATFYQGWIILIVMILSGEIVAMLMRIVRKRRMVSRYARVGVLDGEDQEDTLGVVGIVRRESGQISSLRLDNDSWRDNQGRIQHQLSMTTPRCKICAPCSFRRRISTKYIFQTLLLLLLNLLLIITLSFVSISLMELRSNPHFTESMQLMTPACADPNLVCPSANRDIDRPSVEHWSRHLKSDNRIAQEETTGATVKATNNMSPKYQYNRGLMEPFAYIIASDAQLYWFNGEFPEMGRKPIPSSCSLSDSCGRCTAKHGLNTNLRLKTAWEGLILGTTTGMRRTNATTSSASRVDSDDLPIPNTLVMNGEKIYFWSLYLLYDKHWSIPLGHINSRTVLTFRSYPVQSSNKRRSHSILSSMGEESIR